MSRRTNTITTIELTRIPNNILLKTNDTTKTEIRNINKTKPNISRNAKTVMMRAMENATMDKKTIFSPTGYRNADTSTIRIIRIINLGNSIIKYIYLSKI